MFAAFARQSFFLHVRNNAIRRCSFSNSSLQRRSRTTSSRPPNIPYYIYVIGGGGVALVGYGYFAHLDRVPLTGRRRWIITSSQWESQLGDREYQNLLKQYHDTILPSHHRASVTLRRVGQHIADSSLQFAQQQQQNQYIEAYQNHPYTFTVIQSEMANAFVLPGNHVFLFTGLLQFMKSEDDLAAVLGHEVAHNLARHAGEKISGSFLLNFVALLAWWIDPSLYSLVFPAASLLRDLPNSRTQEMEADEIGLHIAAHACYDPRAAQRLFRTLQEQEGNQGTEFLSTHPSHSRRVEKMAALIPQVLQQARDEGVGYDERCQRVRDRMKQARRQAAAEAAVRERHGV